MEYLEFILHGDSIRMLTLSYSTSAKAGTSEKGSMANQDASLTAQKGQSWLDALSMLFCSQSMKSIWRSCFISGSYGQG